MKLDCYNRAKVLQKTCNWKSFDDGISFNDNDFKPCGMFVETNYVGNFLSTVVQHCTIDQTQLSPINLIKA